MEQHYANSGIKAEAPVSDLQSILNELSTENLRYKEYVEMGYRVGNNLKSFPISASDVDVKEKQPEGLIELLWKEVYKLRSSNHDLYSIVSHFQSIGS